MKRCGDAPLDHGRVVGVGDHGALRRHRVRVADHREERLRLALAVDDPVGVEDLVPAVLGVRLREHGELGVGRRAAEAAIGLLQVVDLVLREREAELRVGPADVLRPLFSGRGATCSNSRAASSKEPSTVWVMRSCSASAIPGCGRVDVIDRAALDALAPRQGRSCARCRSPSTTRATACPGAARPDRRGRACRPASRCRRRAGARASRARSGSRRRSASTK